MSTRTIRKSMRARIATLAVCAWASVANPRLIAAHETNPTGAPHDHFLCYKASGSVPGASTMQLVDGWESGAFDAVKTAAICLPAEIDDAGAPDDSQTLLQSYRIKQTRTSPRQPKHVRQTGLTVLNRLGTVRLDTVKPTRLLVPTAVDGTQPPAPPDDGAHEVDHYKCYKVRSSKGAAKFGGALAQLADAFEDRFYQVLTPRELCVPAATTGQSVKNGAGHLLCYKTKRTGGQPAHSRRSGLFGANEFGSGTLSTKSEDELCVPSVLTDPGCTLDDTFVVIQERIFGARGCNVSTCHGPIGQQGQLDLQVSAAYGELVGITAAHPVAAAAGKTRVVPGDSAASFLSQKLRGTHAPGEGSQMPLVGGQLPDDELDLVDSWIDAGAPPTGIVDGAPCLAPLEYVEQSAPPVPPGGYQMELVGPVLQPGQEQEGCRWRPTPNTADCDVLRGEFVLNPGTHHFAVFDYNRTGAPTTGVWQAGDFGCFSGAQFGNNVSGAPQAPYYVDAYPPGVARRLSGNGYLGLNAHYYNTFDVPIQIRVWINIYPYPGTPSHIAETIIAINDTFSIYVPAFSTALHPGSWTNTSTEPWSIVSLSGHMHKRGERFTEWLPDGSKVYESFDWAHPVFRYFSPPLVLQPGQTITYECEHDNGASDPATVKRRSLGTPCAASETRCIGGPNHDQLCNGNDALCDSSPGAGNGDCDACPLKFGVSAEDEMCILTGQFYRGL